MQVEIIRYRVIIYSIHNVERYYLAFGLDFYFGIKTNLQHNVRTTQRNAIQD